MADLWLPAGPDPLTTHRVESWWVDLLASDETPLGVLDGVTGGTIDQNVNATISGGGSLSVQDTGADVDWLNVRVRPWWQVAGVDPWPLGVFLCSAPVAAYSSTGKTWSVGLLDKLSILDADKVDGSFAVAAGAVVTDAVASVIASAGETAVAITDSAATLSAGMVWEAGTSKLRICNDLLAAINYFSLRCDGYGRYVAGPYQPPADRPVRREFVAGPDAIHVPDFTADQDIASIPNKVVLVGRGSGDTPALVGVAENVDPGSRFSYPSRGRWIVRTETGVEAADQATIDALAARSLAAASTPAATFDFAHAAVPLDLNSMVRLSTADVDIFAAVQKTSQRLVVGDLMRTTVRGVPAPSWETIWTWGGEDGETLRWSYNRELDGAAHGGAYSLGDQPYSSGTWGKAWYPQSGLVPGRVYRFSLWTLRRETYIHTISLSAPPYYGGGSGPEGAAPSPPMDVPFEWTKVSYTFIATSTEHDLTIHINNVSTGSIRSIIDDTAFEILEIGGVLA